MAARRSENPEIGSLVPAKNLDPANRESSEALGWRPVDFGVPAFDSRLVEAVQTFQRERLLPVTGYVDWRTHRAMLGYRESLRVTQKERASRERARKLGNIDLFLPTNPRICRSEPFIGKLIWWGMERSSSQFFDDAQRAGASGVVLPVGDERERERARRRRLRAIARLVPENTKPWIAGREAAAAVNDLEYDGAAVQVPPAWFEQSYGLPFQAFLESYRNRCDIPLGGDIQTTFSRLRSWDVRASFPKLTGLDVGLPRVPGILSQAVEYATGTMVTWWWIYCQIHPAFVFPQFWYEKTGMVARTVYLRTKFDVWRYRKWLDEKGFRGCGWDGARPSHVFPAIHEPIPEGIVCVDGVEEEFQWWLQKAVWEFERYQRFTPWKESALRSRRAMA